MRTIGVESQVWYKHVIYHSPLDLHPRVVEFMHLSLPTSISK
jgi:hypothetical protein